VLALPQGHPLAAAKRVSARDELALGAVPPGLVAKPFEPKRVVRLYAVTRPERPSRIARSFLDTVAALARERRGPGLRAR
jgi:hypothetical protein